jgi:phosphosulfolactate synthase (CoM biosynthesis protein A)
MDELQKISAEIIEIFNTKVNKLTKEQAETINLCNNSMNFYMELGEREKALWEAKYTLKLLNDIVNNGK